MKQTFFDFTKTNLREKEGFKGNLNQDIEPCKPLNYIYDIYIDGESYQFNAINVKLSRNMLIVEEQGCIIEMSVKLFPFNEIRIKRELKR